MKNQPLPLRALWSALGVTAYIVLIGIFFSNANRIFGPEDNFMSPIVALLLFVFSALITGSIVLLPPIRLYLDGQRTEGIKLLFFTAMWLGILTVLAMIVLALL